MELLLSYEASCNSADDKGSSPLHLASWAGHAPVVEMLLTHGPSIANVNLTVMKSVHFDCCYCENFSLTSYDIRTVSLSSALPKTFNDEANAFISSTSSWLANRKPECTLINQSSFLIKISLVCSQKALTFLEASWVADAMRGLR